MAHRDDTTGGTAREDPVGLHIEHYAAVGEGGDGEDVNAVDTEKFVSPGAPVRTRTTSRVDHSRPSGMGAWSLPILGGLDSSPGYATPSVANALTMLISEEPV